MTRSAGLLCSLATTLVLLAGCNARQSTPVSAAEQQAQDDSPGADSIALSNRISVPESVRRNLGIRFAKVESRRVASTLHIPGRFESLPAARREYRTPLAGRVELLVNQYDEVTTGMPLYRLDSMQWRTLQQDLANARAQVTQTSAAAALAEAALRSGEAAQRVTQARIEAGERHIAALAAALQLADKRVEELERVRQIAGGLANDLAEARKEAAAARIALTLAEEEKAEFEQQRLVMATSGEGAFATTPTLEAALHARRAEHEAAKTRLGLARATVRSVLQVPDAALDEPTPAGVPLWESVDEIAVRAVHHGIIETLSLSSGAYADPSTIVMTTLDPDAVRFRAASLQSDLGKLQNGMRASIVPPRGSSVSPDLCIPGTVAIALESDPEERTVDIIVHPTGAVHEWARPGVTAFAELELDGSDDPEPAVPASAIVQDDLEKVLFRRDPADPDKVIRMDADTGVSGGGWVALQSGVAVGDEVVVEGTYQLKLAGSGKIQEGAHVDPDGTVHVGKH
jgi:multidrug efflux pump subunit AcrA (membrane-fusion protein)